MRYCIEFEGWLFVEAEDEDEAFDKGHAIVAAFDVDGDTRISDIYPEGEHN